MKKRVLLVDDEPRVRASLRTVLEPTYEILEAADAAEGLKSFKHDAPDLVLLDVILPGTDGLAALQTMRTENRAVPVIMLTGTKSVKTAVDAMKLGAADYLSKPFDVEELQIVIERTLGKQELEQEVRQLRAQVVQRYAFHNLIGKSPAMQEIYAKIEQVADSRTTVLVTGESGTGKELVAKAIHYNSARRERPFVALNCAALPETLIESELFGHEKGSFTDATARRVGQFELAHTGTLFLDEIGDLSAATQAKLLRVLQEREFTRVGGVQSIKVDVRIVAATNKNLDEMVRKNQFREDLYYRINVIALYLPPLRERGEDIALLAKHFLAKRIEEEKRPPQEFTKGSLELISHYPWPGNVREMENIIEQAFIWSKGSDVITPEHLPNILRTDTRSTSLRDDTLAGRLSLEKAVMEFEREIILDALKRTTYVQTHAAAMLGISRRMLKYRMDTLGISRPDNGVTPEPPLTQE
ncbi:MAG: sigma-54 dependent transcriptional regulator [Nitrospira sp.]|jgi:DNA-binding NtrC family response regulator|uniref:sigma-54-dependent transcriptional regulator n=1 Tax=Nitrospira sp. ND1 TaxID=1658518 RepID=UPI0009BBB999|nr:sigma-54 dependent transcriptional regulator [Nitrospira sp. ND1]MBK7419736.1 sigma-54-dependent Fis family transcriptional regulator [Nitrospira sp.]OYT24161.1 MAG: DNA-binding response regulator [Nitrospira sp. UW-LDO-02]MBK7486660.1 sigma-54-dependent Fis family transcriptional regulator [Nitrospira sp.]MBK8378485.1 sigma-54-dependent Fis family transcriptional regulator [Nitrospira sp.]MBK9999471.1 sigma-54-dependent Fis family transcriptional regulator [Nitrospira sp.]